MPNTGADEIRELLRTHGAQRAAARAQAARESQAIKALAPRAIAAGLSKSEIAALAQISRVALDAMLDD
jgi:hypothetical protein